MKGREAWVWRAYRNRSFFNSQIQRSLPLKAQEWVESLVESTVEEEGQLLRMIQLQTYRIVKSTRCSIEFKRIRYRVNFFKKARRKSHRPRSRSLTWFLREISSLQSPLLHEIRSLWTSQKSERKLSLAYSVMKKRILRKLKRWKKSSMMPKRRAFSKWERQLTKEGRRSRKISRSKSEKRN